MPQRSNVLDLFCANAWALKSAVFDQLRTIVIRHAHGERLTEAEIAAVVADRRERQEERQRELSDEERAILEHLDHAPMAVLEEQRTAVIPMRGVMARFADQVNGMSQSRGRSAESLVTDIRAAIADERLDRMILAIHSPGGMVFGTEDVAAAILEARRSGMRVVAWVDGMADSAALWVASAADEVVLSGETAEIGSLGVITARAVRGEKARELVDVEVFRSVSLKAPGAFGEQLTDEQRGAIRRELQSLHSVFAGAVQRHRGLSDEQLAAVATGEVFFGSDAVAKGLADRIASLGALLAEPAVPAVPGAAAGTGVHGAAAPGQARSATRTVLAAATPAWSQLEQQLWHAYHDHDRLRDLATAGAALLPFRQGQGPGTTDDDEGNVMDKKELLALLAKHADRGATIARCDEHALSAAQTEMVIELLGQTEAAAAQAADDRIAEARKQAEELQAKLQAAEAKRDAAEARAGRLGALGASAGTDAGGDATAPDAGLDAHRDRWEADAKLRQDFALGGFASYLEHLVSRGDLSEQDLLVYYEQDRQASRN